MRVLAITKIFPNRVEPLSAPFNRQQFAALARLCHLEVMATIPWFPGAGLIGASSASKLTEVPRTDTIEGIAVTHPRTLFVPRIAHATWGPLYAASIARAVWRYREQVDVVLGSWVYPDGFAAVLAAGALGVPAVVKVHGSDINANARMAGPRRLLAWALPRAARVVAVSRALADEVAAIGVPRARIAIVLNGVDGQLFYPRDRTAARRELGLPEDARIALYVGNLKVEKGVLDLAAAWAGARVPRSMLAVVGDGPARARLEAAASEGMQVVGARPLASIPTWMAACDVLVLPSHAEGTPNVLLEALACGRRVVATNVGGIPDLVTDDLLGTLVPARDPKALAVAISHALATPYDPARVAERGARGGWDASAEALYAVLRASVGGS